MTQRVKTNNLVEGKKGRRKKRRETGREEVRKRGQIYDSLTVVLKLKILSDILAMCFKQILLEQRNVGKRK